MSVTMSDRGTLIVDVDRLMRSMTCTMKSICRRGAAGIGAVSMHMTCLCSRKMSLLRRSTSSYIDGRGAATNMGDGDPGGAGASAGVNIIGGGKLRVSVAAGCLKVVGGEGPAEVDGVRGQARFACSI